MTLPSLLANWSRHRRSYQPVVRVILFVLDPAGQQAVRMT